MSALTTMISIETRLFLRDTTNVIFGLLFPTALLLGMGAVPVLRSSPPELGGLRLIDVWAPTALVFGIVLITVQHIPTAIATYRERGVLRRLSTTPVNPKSILVAQLVVVFGCVLVSATLTILAAWVVLDIALPEQPLHFIAAFVAGFAAVLGISMISAAVARTGSAATSIGTVLFVGLMFFGGAFLPRTLMPETLVRIGEFVPPGLQALVASWSPAAGEITAGGQPFWLQVAIMAGIAVVTSMIAARLFRWE